MERAEQYLRRAGKKKGKTAPGRGRATKPGFEGGKKVGMVTLAKGKKQEALIPHVDKCQETAPIKQKRGKYKSMGGKK